MLKSDYTIAEEAAAALGVETPLRSGALFSDPVQAYALGMAKKPLLFVPRSCSSARLAIAAPSRAEEHSTMSMSAGDTRQPLPPPGNDG